MADAVTSQTLVDGERNVVMKFTNISDGTGEAAVAKVTAASLSGAPARLRIDRIIANTDGMAVNILWDATADVTAWVVAQNTCEEFDFRSFGGLANNAGAGITGNINFTTVGHSASDTYSIILHMTKT